jgi:hypothetical protein
VGITLGAKRLQYVLPSGKELEREVRPAIHAIQLTIPLEFFDERFILGEREHDVRMRIAQLLERVIDLMPARLCPSLDTAEDGGGPPGQ